MKFVHTSLHSSFVLTPPLHRARKTRDVCAELNGAAQSHIGELMEEREDFILASKAQARRVAELEASLAAATELHGAAQEQLEVQSLIAAHRATRIHELEEETRAQANTMGKCVEPPPCKATAPHSNRHTVTHTHLGSLPWQDR